MQKLKTIALALYILVFFAVPVQAQTVNTLVLAGIKSTNSDISLQVLQEGYAKLGIKVELIAFPIIRALHAAKSGQVDGELFKADGLERQYPDLIKVPVPVNHIDLMLLTKKDLVIPNRLDSLQKYRIGIYRGVVHTKEMLTKAGCKNVHEIETHAQILKMIELDRLDVSIIARIAGQKLLKKSGSTQLHLIAPPLRSFLSTTT